MTRAAIYVRISDDRAGDSAGVRRQEVDCRARAKALGWTVAEVYVDNDVSAYSGKPRPAYRRLTDDIKARRVDAVIVWHLDRLTRRPAELETFFDLCDAAGIANLASCTGDIDLSTHDGRFTARILGAVARKESDDKGRRTRRKHLEVAEAGRPAGGTRPFGYEADKITVRESEAALIRSAAEQVLAGDSLRSITLRWRQQDIRMSRGSHITAASLKRILISPRIAGKRALKGVVVADAVWPAILDETTWNRVRAVLAARSGTPGGFGPRTNLLTGIVVCGRCGSKLIGQRHTERRRTYVCTATPPRSGCGRMRIIADDLDELVVKAVLKVLASPVVARATRAQVRGARDDGTVLAAIAQDEATLEQLAVDHYTEGIISREQFIAASTRLQHRLDEQRSKLAASAQAETVRPLAGKAMSVAEWEALDFDRRHVIVAELVDRIEIAPGRRGLGRFDPGRVTIVWR